jgi:hypothetical protein
LSYMVMTGIAANKASKGVQLLWNHWKQALQWRILYLARSRKGDASHTVLITDIPGTPQGTIFGRIFDVCSSLALLHMVPSVCPGFHHA